MRIAESGGTQTKPGNPQASYVRNESPSKAVLLIRSYSSCFCIFLIVAPPTLQHNQPPKRRIPFSITMFSKFYVLLLLVAGALAVPVPSGALIRSYGCFRNVLLLIFFQTLKETLHPHLSTQ